MFTFETANVKGEIERKVKPDPSAKFLVIRGAWGPGVRKSFDFTAKGTSVISFEPLCVKIGLPVWPPGRFGKK